MRFAFDFVYGVKSALNFDQFRHWQNARPDSDGLKVIHKTTPYKLSLSTALHVPIGIKMYLTRIFSALILMFSSMSYSAFAEESLKIEDFSTFIRYFYSNTKFQALHVQYPLEKTSYEDSINGPTEVKSNLTKENWVTLTSKSFSCTVNCYDVFIYDKFSGIESESNERVLSYKGVDNGIYEALYFRRINGDWFLVKYVVSSI